MITFLRDRTATIHFAAAARRMERENDREPSGVIVATHRPPIGPNTAVKRAVFALATLSLAACASPSLTTPSFAPASAVDGTRHADAASTPAPVQAATTQSFVDSVGTNVHLAYYGTAYDPGTFSTLQSLLTQSGIKHLRDGMPLGQTPVVAEMQQLASSGIRFDFLMTPGSSSANVSAWFQSVGANVADACEGDNEPDLSGDPAWPIDARTDQQTLYGVCHALGLAVGGPAMGGGSGDYATFGNQSSSMDLAVMHNYYGWRNPGTAGTDQNGYGSLAYDVAAAAAEAPGKGVASTETGYDSDSAATSTYLPEAIRARYLVRTMLEDFRAGVPRTYSYEFADEGGQPYDQMGLVTSALKAKPAYYALQGLLGGFADATPFSPGSLAFTLAGADASLHSKLFEKSDGSYWLALWKEAEEYDGDGVQQTEPQAAENVTVAFASAAATATSYVLQDSGGYAATKLAAQRSYALAVDGHLTVLSVTGFKK